MSHVTAAFPSHLLPRKAELLTPETKGSAATTVVMQKLLRQAESVFSDQLEAKYRRWLGAARTNLAIVTCMAAVSKPPGEADLFALGSRRTSCRSWPAGW